MDKKTRDKETMIRNAGLEHIGKILNRILPHIELSYKKHKEKVSSLDEWLDEKENHGKPRCRVLESTFFGRLLGSI